MRRDQRSLERVYLEAHAHAPKTCDKCRAPQACDVDVLLEQSAPRRCSRGWPSGASSDDVLALLAGGRPVRATAAGRHRPDRVRRRWHNAPTCWPSRPSRTRTTRRSCGRPTAPTRGRTTTARRASTSAPGRRRRRQGDRDGCRAPYLPSTTSLSPRTRRPSSPARSRAAHPRARCSLRSSYRSGGGLPPASSRVFHALPLSFATAHGYK